MVVSTLGWANHQVILSLGFWSHVSEILVRICSLETEEIKNHEQGGSHIGLCSEAEGKPVNRERRQSTSKEKAVSSDLKARGAETEMS